MSRDIAPFPVRLPADLREKLDASSKDAGRSLNSEIVDRLEKSFPSIDQMILRHRADEIREIDIALLELNQKVVEVRTHLVQRDDPHFRYSLQKLLDRMRVLNHHRDMLDADLTNMRDGLAEQAIADE